MDSFHFQYPHFLWLLGLLPVLAWWWLRGRPRAAVTFPGFGLLDSLPSTNLRWPEILSLCLRLAAIGLLILGLARPRWPDLRTRIPAESRAIQMVLDVSGSMNESDFRRQGQTVTRLQAAKDAFKAFVQGQGQELEGRKNDLIGLVTFAARVEDACPPTLSHYAVLQLLDEAKPIATPPDSSTNIGDAMVEGLELLREAKPKTKVMIVLSDGEHNVPANVVPNALKPRQAARLAEALGIRVHTIFVGPGGPPSSAEGPPTKDNSEEGRKALEDVAAITRGLAFRADDTETLAKVWQQIDSTERTRVESFQYYRYHEGYPWVGLGSVVFMLAYFWLEGRRLP